MVSSGDQLCMRDVCLRYSEVALGRLVQELMGVWGVYPLSTFMVGPMDLSALGRRDLSRRILWLS